MQLALMIYAICTTISIVLLVIRVTKLEHKSDGMIIVDPYSDEAPIKIDFKIDYIELMQRGKIVLTVNSVKIDKSFIIKSDNQEEKRNVD